jgi:predicted small integral membrane protein
MTKQFAFDPANKILLLRIEKRLTDELARALYWEVRKLSTATDASAAIYDLSAVTDFAVSPEFIRELVNRDPAMPDATSRPRCLVAPTMLGLAMSRLCEIAVGSRNPLLKIVLSLDEAFAALGLQSPHFVPLDLSKHFCPSSLQRMCSLSRPTERFEFDSVNKILLLRVERRLTDESLAEAHQVARKYWAATDARAGIADYSSVTKFALSAKFIRHMAAREPAMPDATKSPLFLVTPTTTGYGLARMYQIVGGRTVPLTRVVRTMDKALEALGVQSPHFEPLE